jgi:hypothetical protein
VRIELCKSLRIGYSKDPELIDNPPPTASNSTEDICLIDPLAVDYPIIDTSLKMLVPANVINTEESRIVEGNIGKLLVVKRYSSSLR